MLKIGDKAPDFQGLDQNNNPIKLSDYKGTKLVIYFYPKDNTPGCTAQACNLRDNYNSLIQKGYKIIGISKDSTASHQKFIEKYQLPFPLISDTSTEIIKLYDAWGQKKFMGKTYEGILRKTYIIDSSGIIADIIEKVQTKDHASQITK
jgi:peroxiredoxin Q/BCP